MPLETTLRTTKKSFKLGEKRILAILFLLLLAPAGSWPASMLQLRFVDLELVLRRDPNNPGARRFIIRMTLRFTNCFLGPKSAKKFQLPEIIYKPYFLLSPHVLLLIILFQHRDFRAETLNDNPQVLETMPIHDGDAEARLPIKRELMDMLVFRRAEQSVCGWEMIDKLMTYSQMAYWVRRIGRLVGLKSNTICYRP
ncbi:hypothetical protein N0V93_010274 [Gnomoniopsis smithogilvyi]|uniref:Uncharacterized protein n=1 Tax=Gnomoniopsis smithogilvyi TaxID=1191159 RepID=A0A9W8YIG2_9PEZI|nr:hypothetical protein N0V93_010274 [Gnomoniopsis smithogilvyi]